MAGFSVEQFDDKCGAGCNTGKVAAICHDDKKVRIDHDLVCVATCTVINPTCRSYNDDITFEDVCKSHLDGGIVNGNTSRIFAPDLPPWKDEAIAFEDHADRRSMGGGAARACRNAGQVNESHELEDKNFECKAPDLMLSVFDFPTNILQRFAQQGPKVGLGLSFQLLDPRRDDFTREFLSGSDQKGFCCVIPFAYASIEVDVAGILKRVENLCRQVSFVECGTIGGGCERFYVA